MSEYNTYNDQELVALIGGDNRRIFEEVFHRYNKRLFPHVLKFVRSAYAAEEIIQEIFMRLWLNRVAVSAMDNPGAWLFTVATNLSLDFLKKQNNQQNILDELQRSSETSFTDEQVILREHEDQLHHAINHLSPRRQIIYKMSREEGMSHTDISRELNISSSTVNNQLVSALQHIRSYMKRAGILMLAIFFS